MSRGRRELRSPEELREDVVVDIVTTLRGLTLSREQAGRIVTAASICAVTDQSGPPREPDPAFVKRVDLTS